MVAVVQLLWYKLKMLNCRSWASNLTALTHDMSRQEEAEALPRLLSQGFPRLHSMDRLLQRYSDNKGFSVALSTFP